MNIYFIRHTTPDIKKGICYGQSDIGVTNEFEEESDFLLSKIKDIPKYTVISSPLKRCLKLAYKISLDATTNPYLKELNFGDWELKLWDEIPKEQLDPWMEDYVRKSPTNGESYQELYDRVVHFYRSIELENTIVVTHAGVIRSMLAHITKTSLKNSFDFKIPYGAVIRINAETHEYEIL